MNTEPLFWSIIVPVYNETKRVHNLNKIFRYLGNLKEPWELIVVNDGSRDDTLQKLDLFKRKSNFKLISYRTNRGKGFAVKTGMLAASGKFRLFCDIDLSTPIDEMRKIKKTLTKTDVAIGTRKLKGAKIILHQSLLRESLGRVFTWLSQLILNTWVSDFTCGFKCFSRRASEKIFKKTRIFRWGFDSEVLFLAKKYGLTIKEVPVVWKNDPQTKVRFPRDLVNSLAELILIRYYELKGFY